jgi:hypothetical protein
MLMRSITGHSPFFFSFDRLMKKVKPKVVFDDMAIVLFSPPF